LTWFWKCGIIFLDMITTSSQTTLKQSDDFDSVSFGIKESGLSHIFNVLRNQLYSDKILAVIREYSTNAVDAHIEAGRKDQPIKVTLPTQLTPEFKVRDFGLGLTEEQVAQIYAMYGESTKRGSNEQIGQLGLGSKSAFAYGDNFVINSFVKGDKVTYNAFIDPSDVGQISKIHSEKTDEQDGIEIVIPVKSDDYDEFYRKATSLYKYFKVIPDVRGASQEQLKDDLKRDEVVVGKDNWTLVKGNSYAVMGNIAYPLDSSALNLNWQDERAELISAGIVIDFAIGDLEISASREALQYTDTTKKVIINKLEAIIKELPDVLGEKFEECDTLWEVKCLYNEAFAHGGFGQKIRKLVETKGVMWRGIKVSSGSFSKNKWKDEDIELKVFSKPNTYGTRKRVRGEEGQNIYAKEGSLIIYDDAPSHHGRLNRIAPLLENYDKRDEQHKDTPVYDTVYLINFRSTKAKKEFFDQKKLDFPAKKLTEYPKVVLRDIYPSNSTVSGGTNTTKNSKHNTKVFSLDQFCSHGQYHTCRSDFFESNEVNLDDGGVYVIVDKFFWGKQPDGQNHPAYLVDKVKHMTDCGIDVPTIYALKPTDKNLEAVKYDSWNYFEDWAVEEFQNYLGENGHTKDLFHKICAEQHRQIANRQDEFCEGLLEMNERNDDFLDSLPDSLAKDYITRYLEMNQENNSELAKLRDTFKVLGKSNYGSHYNSHIDDGGKPRKPDMRGILNHCWGDDYDWPEYNLNDMNEQCQKRYPMITLMDDSHYNWRGQKESAEAASQYITLVEGTYNAKKKIANAKGKIERILDNQPQNI
jgi:hypothetical protein